MIFNPTSSSSFQYQRIDYTGNGKSNREIKFDFIPKVAIMGLDVEETFDYAVGPLVYTEGDEKIQI